MHEEIARYNKNKLQKAKIKNNIIQEHIFQISHCTVKILFQISTKTNYVALYQWISLQQREVVQFTPLNFTTLNFLKSILRTK